MDSDASFSSTDLDPLYMRPREDYQPPSDTGSGTIHIWTDEEEYLTERRERLDELSTEASASIGGSEMASSDDLFATDLSSLVDDADADDEHSSNSSNSSSSSSTDMSSLSHVVYVHS
ncbi:hypothetical protein O0I10_004871 [Lichtheimia ornata]|uniref:Uncharacterized protein n=1 Tax=Lichtheimia ornata TaxID=688661 RepID=A0AAD7V6N7_9FUNG|nr:uncharacterized protein O0I10_004871 [Lichtheimia ornata]KAJ8659506.1 hypothetical protein O0I10_004871 [Lichtheimia ornata]